MRGILYFFAEIRFPAHWPASSHFFVEISRLMCARDRPGPGSSDAIRPMAACASVKTVTRWGTVFLPEADSSVRASAARFAS